MPTLILSGGKGRDNEKKLNSLFLKFVGNKPILYIPIAKDAKYYGQCYNWVTSIMPGKKINLLVDFKLQKIDVSDFGGVYIGGGNCFKLLKEIKENKFENKLKNFKGIIYGGSAGAIIFGKTIETASWGIVKDKNKIKLKDLRGLNLINGYNIKAHYSEKERGDVKKFVKKTEIPIIALPEDSGILVKDKKIKPINDVLIFR